MIAVVGCIGLQTLFYNALWYRSEKHGAESEEETPSDFECDTLYLDIGLPFEQILVLFTAQVFIWWFYFTSILYNFDFHYVNYMFWMVAFLSMQMTMIFSRGPDSVLGKPFPVHDVYILQTNCDNILLKMRDTEEAAMTPRFIEKRSQPFSVTKGNIILRGVLGFFCNAILREIMAYTLPLMLMGFAEPMDFVVYCVGANFITTVDDMKERVFEVIPNSDEEAFTSAASVAVTKGITGTRELSSSLKKVPQD